MKQRTMTLYPITKVAQTRPTGTVKTPAFFMKALLPTLGTMLFTQLILHFTDSGYSVIVLLLLSVLLYTAYSYGTLPAIVSSLLIGGYNFVVISQVRDVPILSPAVMQGGVVIALVFPVLAFIIGNLKARNDMLLEREHDARTRAEESARQLQFMAEAMPQKIFTNLPNGKNVYSNAQWAEYTGASRKAMQNWGSLIHPHDVKENLRLWKLSMETGEPFQFEHRLRRADGAYIWHLTRAQPLRDEDGKITLWIGSSTDIEDIRKARKLESETARLIKQRTQLMELNKAKDEFISIASHQLRTPATGVKQYLNMALDGYGGTVPVKLRPFLAKANASNERQIEIINDLLQVAQVDAGKVILRKEPVNVTKVITSILRDHKSTLTDRKQTATFIRTKRAMTVDADPTKFRMIVDNLIDNASKYSTENTAITVRVTKYRGMVRVSVTDQGVGIDKADMPKVFEKFIRIDNPLSTKVGGNGLGLYWVQKVVELHGGTITVTSKKNAGSTFVVSLPEAA